MTTSSTAATTTETRSVETSIALPARPERVWQALTQAQELMRWFPPLARVRPGVGGSIFMSWDGSYEGESGIQLWEPPRRLRTAWVTGESVPGSDAAPALVVDYALESDSGGGTILRLVHSGFGRDAAWDGMYDSVSRGWHFELRCLRHYLAHHDGRDRLHAWARMPVRIDRASAWRKLTGAKGLNAPADFDRLREGDRYAITTATGDTLRGTVIDNVPQCQFAGTVEGFGGGVVRFHLEPQCDGVGDYVGVWLASWDARPQELVDFKHRWTRQLESLFRE